MSTSQETKECLKFSVFGAIESIWGYGCHCLGARKWTLICRCKDRIKQIHSQWDGILPVSTCIETPVAEPREASPGEHEEVEPEAHVLMEPANISDLLAVCAALLEQVATQPTHGQQQSDDNQSRTNNNNTEEKPKPELVEWCRSRHLDEQFKRFNIVVKQKFCRSAPSCRVPHCRFVHSWRDLVAPFTDARIIEFFKQAKIKREQNRKTPQSYALREPTRMRCPNKGCAGKFDLRRITIRSNNTVTDLLTYPHYHSHCTLCERKITLSVYK